MDRDKIISKIIKCLRLAESGNPNEAASALRQAHGLMRKYGIFESDIAKLAINESTAGSGGYYNPPYWALALSELIAEAFECRVYLARREAAHPQFRFIGREHRASVAAYSFTVLYRRLRLARRQYMKGLELEDRQEARRLGNVFAQAWLYRIARVVAEFNAEPSDQAMVDDYVRDQYGETTETMREYTDPNTEDYYVILSGMRAAQAVSLFRPVHRGKSQKLRAKVCA
ncbi:MAG: DUF2786 domain-containing protein [Gammaproteobacteria bacterium]